MDALDLMLARRSIRRFTTQDVSLDDEEKLVDAAFAAPSANNERPWHFVCVRDPEMRRRLSGLHQWTRMLDKAPLVIAVLGRAHGHPWWIEDCSAATENILVAAVALGLGGVWLGCHGSPERESAVRAVLGIPGSIGVLSLLSIGSPAEEKEPRTQFDPACVHPEGW